MSRGSGNAMATTTMATPGSSSGTRVIDHPPPVPRRGPWEMATVVEVRTETASAKTFRLALPHPSIHLAGQHYLVRLTAPDGYTATRSYSVASPPDGSAEIELTVELLPDGEVSGFLHEEVMIGDTLEVRGPIGGWFVWRGESPVVLVGGGSGVVPLMAMLRLARRTGRSDLVRLVVSARSPDDLYYAAELPGPETTIVYTRSAPPSSPRPVGRLNPSELRAPLAPDPPPYGCGTPRVDGPATRLRPAPASAPR